MALWADLPQELVNLIASKTNTIVCFVRFRTVCKSWNSATTSDSTHKLPAVQPPWLLLGDDDENKQLSLSPSSINFLSCASNESFKLEVPHDFLRHCPMKDIVGSSGTCLIKFHDETRTLHLINPLSQLIETDRFPSLLTVTKRFLCGRHTDCVCDCETQENLLLTKVVLSPTARSVAVAILGGSGSNFLAFARAGDREWSALECPSSHPTMELIMDEDDNGALKVRTIDDVVFYKQRLYVVNDLGEVFVCDNINGGLCRGKTRISGPLIESESHSQDVSLTVENYGRGKQFYIIKHYLVEVNGSLMLVLRILRCRHSLVAGIITMTQKFKVFKLDLGAGKRVVVKSLGNYSLFLGLNGSVASRASVACAFRKNCIYFSDDYDYKSFPVQYLDMGVFNLENGRVRYLHVDINSVSCLPVWMVPSSMST